ncbi:MAG TPA: hypothetical protein VJX94_08000 [Stellaceae bacterium]|nr:hypothetical protein [Stellaceae bacterium]
MTAQLLKLETAQLLKLGYKIVALGQHRPAIDDFAGDGQHAATTDAVEQQHAGGIPAADSSSASSRRVSASRSCRRPSVG